MRNLNEKITENFTFREFIYSDVATRHNIDNTPKDDIIWKNLEKLIIDCLQPIRNEFGPIRILSGFRCQELNRVVGGSKTSSHCFGFASDFEPIDISIKLIDIVNWIYNNLKWKELIAEYFPGGWIHLSYVKNLYTTDIKLKDENHNYKVVSLNYLNKLYK